MGETLVWLFGRGASISCNLSWFVPPDWRSEPRDEQIRRIKKALMSEMQRESINTEPYRLLLSAIAQRTRQGWKHLFVTTNWDTLLEQEIERLCPNECPSWLESAFVYHYNGSIESPSNEFRTPFLLETDPPSERQPTVEGNKAFNLMIWERYFVLVGMSFDCPMDRFLLNELGSVGDDLPIGESHWIVLNPNQLALEAVRNRIGTVLPRSQTTVVPTKFDGWLLGGMTDLVGCGALSK